MAPAIAFPALDGAVRRLVESEITTPTRTLSQVVNKVLGSRQETTTIVADPGESSAGASTLDGGSIAGIVIGSIAGILLLVWIIRSCSNMGNPNGWGKTYEPEREKPVRSSAYADPHRHRSRSRHSHHSHHHHSRSPRRVEVIQPVVYPARGRSPRAPSATYYGGGSRRSSDTRRHSGY